MAGRLARTLVEQRVVAQLMPMRRRRPPFGHAPRHGRIRQLQVEAAFQAGAVERGNRVVELGVEGVVVGQADRGASAFGPGKAGRGGGGQRRLGTREQQYGGQDQVQVHEAASPMFRERFGNVPMLFAKI
jgi:hypothetical protein